MYLGRALSALALTALCDRLPLPIEDERAKEREQDDYDDRNYRYAH